jgi:hypothetical protein
MLRFAFGLACTLLLAVALAACGGDEDAGTATPAATVEQTGSPAATETPSVAGTTPASPPSSRVTPRATATQPMAAASLVCADPQPPFVTDLDVRQTPGLPEPAPRPAVRDPVFGSCMVRVTDRTADLISDDNSPGIKNEYSRVQSFNADGSRLLVMGLNATWYVYDVRTLRPMAFMPFGGPVEPRWDATDPDVLYYLEETRLMEYNLGSELRSVVHDFAADFPGQSLAAVWTRYEGSPSADTRYWGLMAEDQDWLTTAFLIYDRQEDRVVATRDLRGASEIDREIDTVIISPLGNYFLAYFDEYCEQGQLGSDAEPCGLMVYDRDLKNGRSLLRIVGHGDLALDAEGREVMVYQDIDTDHISLLDLASGAVTPLQPIDFSQGSIGLHISGRALQRPGWALVSTYNGGHPVAFTWMDDSVFALELKSGGRVVRLAHTRSVFQEGAVSYGEKDYWAEPHGSVNPDFTRVVFTSNWGRSGTEEVDTFMISLPPDWVESLD